MKNKELLWKRLKFIYESEETTQEVFDKILAKLEKYGEPEHVISDKLTEKDTMLITYGDSIKDGDRAGLEVLGQFLEEHVGDAIENVHLLPMYPYTSDDGFSVVDYRKINPVLGDWPQVNELAKKHGLMFDAVINHISKSSEWFQRYLRCEEPYKDYFITCDPDADYSLVTRPRTLRC